MTPNERQIMFDAVFAPMGVNVELQCPDCGKSTLSVKKTSDGVYYHCWRASCGIAGHIAEVGTITYISPELAPTEPQLTPFTGLTTSSTYFDRAELSRRFGLSDTAVNIWISKLGVLNDRRVGYLLDIRSPEGIVRGQTWRFPWGKETSKSKAIIYKEKHEPMLAWYLPDEWRGPLVLVEDQMSAIKLCDCSIRACALLGTELNAEKVHEIQGVSLDVVLALDADATSQAFKLARRWASAFQMFRVEVLTKDVKDMSRDDINQRFT